jgi:hypothetical protein
LLRVLKPRSQMAAALATRVADLEKLANPFELSGVPLLASSGKPFNVDAEDPFYLTKSRVFFGGSSSVTDAETLAKSDEAGLREALKENDASGYEAESGFGITVQLSESALMFLGMEDKLLQLLAKQDFAEICSYSFEPRTSTEQVSCVVSAGRARRMQLPGSIEPSGISAEGYESFQLDGQMHCSRAGVVFGVLPLPRE